MDFELVPVAQEDFQAFVEMDADVFGLPDAFMDDWFSHFQNFWAVADGERVGAVMLGVHMGRWVGDLPLPQRGSLYVSSIGFLPQFRRQGHGREVLSWLAPFARRNQCTRIVFETRASNAAMQQLAFSAGYSLVEVDPGFYQEPREAAMVFERRVHRLPNTPA